MPPAPEVSSLTLNRLSIYLRSLRQLEEEQVGTVSSQELARRFHLSATQIRKDLAQFGEFGIRGVGYEVAQLAQRLSRLLGLDRRHALVIYGVGHLGSALAEYWGFNHGPFEVVAGFDNDPRKIGQRVASLTIAAPGDLERLVRETGAEIGVLTVPASAACAGYLALVDAGIRGILNFTLQRLEPRPGVRVKNVDLRINLEELAFHLTG